MKKPLLLALSSLLLLATPAFADQAPADATAVAQKQQDIRQLLKVVQATHLAQSAMDQMLPSLRRMVPGLSEKDWQGLVAELKSEFSEDKLAALYVPIYEKYFSDAEIQQLTAFYQTPTGAKFVSAQPQLLADCAAVGQDLGRRAAMRFFEKLESRGVKPGK